MLEGVQEASSQTQQHSITVGTCCQVKSDWREGLIGARGRRRGEVKQGASEGAVGGEAAEFASGEIGWGEVNADVAASESGLIGSFGEGFPFQGD